jgi:hypothetical protein
MYLKKIDKDWESKHLSDLFPIPMRLKEEML